MKSSSINAQRALTTAGTIIFLIAGKLEDELASRPGRPRTEADEEELPVIARGEID